MKYFLFFLLFTGAINAAESFNIDLIDEVRSIEHNELANEVMVTFWGNNKVYRMDDSHSALPCLEEAHKSQKQVALSFDENNHIILKCKLLDDLGQ